MFLDSLNEDSTKDIEFLKIYSLVMILFFNLYFLLRWLHLFLYSFKSKNPLLVGIRRILGFSLMSEKEKELTGQTRFSNKGMKRRPTEKK